MRNRTNWAFAVVLAAGILLAGAGQSHSTNNFELVPKIAFSTVRDLPDCLAAVPVGMQPSIGEIYLMSPDGTNVQQLTDNENCTHGDAFAALSGDGKKIVFDRFRRATDPLNSADQFLISNLFLMAADGTDQQLLIQGSSASWSPAVAENNQGAPISRQIVFHASASGTSLPIRPDPGAPTFDSDLFVLNVDDCLQFLSVQPGANCRDLATDITKDLQPGPMAPNYNGDQFTPLAAPAIEEDANWSPDGTKVVFTSHPAVSGFCTPSGTCNYADTEIYTVNPDGTGLGQLTHNNFEERAPAWSPDGLHIAYMCRIGQVNAQGLATFEICLMDATGDGDGTKYRRLTSNKVFDATPSWSPDSTQIVLHRNPPPFQLYVVKADTSCVQNPDGSPSCSCPSGTYPASGNCEMQLTNTLGVMNGFPDWGEVRVRAPKQ